MIVACAFCGRDNESGSRYCMDCGKPLSPSAARAISYSPAASSRAVADMDAGAAGVRPAMPPHAPHPAGAGGGPPPGVGYRGPGAPLRPPHDAGVPMVTCPRCARRVDAALPYCGACGTRLAAAVAPAAAACRSCGTAPEPGDLFCARCGGRVGSRVSVDASAGAQGTLKFEARPHSLGPQVALLDEEGEVVTVFTLERGEAVIGRGDADIRFKDDTYMSPLHARIEMRDGRLWLRDLGSRNLSWVFLEDPSRLADGDMLLVGSQVVRFRRLGFPGPWSQEADATRRMGSLTPSADVAVLEQLRPDGSVRDALHLSPGRTVVLGREAGDWVFPYDLTMSGRHVEIRSEDSDFVVYDIGSRNGVALAVRGDRLLRTGQRLLLGDQILRVESV